MILMMSISSQKEQRLTGRHFQLACGDHNTHSAGLHTLDTHRVVTAGSPIEDHRTVT